MERPRLAGSPKRKIYKRDNTALKSVCQGEMCGKMHFMWIPTRKGSQRDAGAPYSLRRRQQGGKLPHRDKGTSRKFCTVISYLNAATFKEFSCLFVFFRC